MSTATDPQIASPGVQQLPPFGVILHNDHVNHMGRVVEVLVRVLRIPAQNAIALMLESHNDGESVVCRTHRERAEFLRECLDEQGLLATVRRI
jgi:ATP-dependent Clp protease adaptor protein ClpS